MWHDGRNDKGWKYEDQNHKRVFDSGGVGTRRPTGLMSKGREIVKGVGKCALSIY